MVNEFSRRTFVKIAGLTVGGTAVTDVPVRAQQSVSSEAQRVPHSRQQERGIKLQTVGIMSPGDMGSAVGQVLAKQGLTVIAALGDRTGAKPLYADCNSIALQSARKISEIMKAVGAPFAEASIIGAPPRVPNKTRFYASGPHAQDFAQLNQFGLNVRNLGPEEDKAKAIKICYATVTKGAQALCTESFVSAKRLGVFDVLMTEFETSQKGLLKFARDGLQLMPPKAHRWVGEMNELAATYQGLGLTPRILAGAADMYRDVSRTTLGHESPENQRKLDRSFDAFIATLERDLPRG
jgi:3-hydroxyisobutyrate dehydrogenase-like beta-hydroxyacid dehydrogenase